MKILSVRKAYGRASEAACIMITEDTEKPTGEIVKEHHRDAQRIFEIFCYSLPGMTFDRLYQLMKEEKNLQVMKEEKNL